MLIGAHESVAGGVANAIVRGAADQCEAIQIFTRNSNQWKAKPVTQAEAELFRKARQSYDVPVLVHDSYLINLGGSGELLAKSTAAFREEIERCELLGADFLVMHPGAHLGAGEEAALTAIAGHLRDVIAETPGFRTRILIENTAGQGTSVGYRLEHLRFLLETIGRPERTGICFDTQHAFAAGYDLATAEGYEETWGAFDRNIGFDALRAFHINDSKKPLGCRVDRHEHIGKGELGLDFFRRLVNDARFERVPGVLETPPLGPPEKPFSPELERLRALREPA